MANQKEIRTMRLMPNRASDIIIRTVYSNDNNQTFQVDIIWNANYRNDGVSASILASFLRLNDDVNFVKSTLDSFYENYYASDASSCQGVTGSDEWNQALQILHAKHAARVKIDEEGPARMYSSREYLNIL